MLVFGGWVMRLKAVIGWGSVFLIMLGGIATAQTASDMMNIFGGLVRSGIAAAVQSAWEPAKLAQPSPHPEYVVDGLSLGSRVLFSSRTYRDYQCRLSEQFDGFTFCQKRREMSEARGNFTSSNTILHSTDGTAVYINRLLEPAFFNGNEAQADLDARTKRFGSQPSRIIPMPSNSVVPNGMIVSWGKVVLEPLTQGVLRDIAGGRGARVGFMIDHIGNLRRSAMLGLPIYRLRGGAGYVWAASWNQNGVGTLQFLTTDPSTFIGEPTIEPNVTAVQSDSSDSKKPVEKTEAEKTEDLRLAAEKAATEKAATEKAAADKAVANAAAAEKAATEKVAAEKAAAERTAAAAQAAADKAARDAEIELARKTEVRRKGVEYANSSGTKWNISHKKNEMTDRVDVKVRSVQKSEEGFIAEVEGSCKDGVVSFSVLIVDDDGKPTVNLVGRSAIGDVGRGVAALRRVNDNNPNNVILPELEFNNKLQVASFPSLSRKMDAVEKLRMTVLVVSGANIFADQADTWRVMADIKTTVGEIIVKVPIFDPNVQELFQTCQ